MTHADALHKLMEWTATGANGISAKQYNAWLGIFKDYPPEVCMRVVDAFGPKYTNIASVPMGSVREALFAIAPPRKKFSRSSSTTNTAPPSRKISAWWGTDGQWGGDWTGSQHAVLVRVWAEMDYAAWGGHRDRVDEFRRVCIGAGVDASTLEAARAARKTGDWALSRFISATYGPR